MDIVIIKIGNLAEAYIGFVQHTKKLAAVEELQHEWSIALKWWDWMRLIHIHPNEIELFM